MQRLKDHPALYEIFARKLGIDPAERVHQSELKFEQELKQARQMKKKAVLADLPEYWSPYKGGPHHAKYEVDTGISAEEIRKISDGLTAYPKDFHIHPKIKKLLEQRAEMGAIRCCREEFTGSITYCSLARRPHHFRTTCRH